MTQLFAIRINSTLQQLRWDIANLATLEKRAMQGPLVDYEVNQVNTLQARIAAAKAGQQVYTYHSGGKGNGAIGGLYEKKQINRIIGRYPEGIAVAVPVAFGFTQAEAIDNESEAEILAQARSYGVDNWEGWGEWNTEEDDE